MHLLPYPALLLSVCSVSLAILAQDIAIDVDTNLASPPIHTTSIASTISITNAEPTPLHRLPTLLAPSSPSIRTIDTTAITESIRTTLALYPLAVDGKNFAALSSIFAADAVANYSAPLNVLTPLESIQDTLSASLACVSTQHSLGTQIIDVVSPMEARSVTYYTASHFGRSTKMAKQVATAHGQYQDLWRRQEDGSWRVVVRNLVYMVFSIPFTFSFFFFLFWCIANCSRATLSGTKKYFGVDTNNDLGIISPARA
ncbi:hypothetical protein ASPSYDRAFT_648348 [Aspergillus sydowii CBS 593.65]|uniref:SnoaL-like domain-containing protein n=1 Tax=Aspergillus sydowii CBS 593.65 TaxID=1036612 RepID=A0A1L9TSN9_9EURO|nr:uncharacterized protein ASPSYDRAFT_648348 [Aspergillus sydowii CBS 593.65]OJJ62466.1 hypothetical protein ASPSYDRAFT_648348 [Aspergillus sydowii CBS 593.65]